MSDTLLDRLQALLKHKKSKAYYAEKLGISESEVESLMSELVMVMNLAFIIILRMVH
jgi:hypothetical protein